MRVFDNLLYKVAALVIAFALWSAAQGFRTEERSLDIPIAVEAPGDLVVVNQSVNEINLTLTGSRAALRRAEKNLVSYPIMLEEARPGQRTVTVTKDSLARDLPRGAKILARSPSKVFLEIDRVVPKELPVKVDVVGDLPDGYRLLSIRVDPSEVEIEGAQQVVRRLREVRTERIDLSRLRESTVQEIPLLFGVDHVWRAGEGRRGEPVRVEVQIETQNGNTPE